jgi:3-phenylpropionate/trans-cinnamate dioxygenase ferredoxin reductase component
VADRRVDHLLVGGGIASSACAEALRDGGAEGSILLVGRELDPPYDRPPCSKEYLRGEKSREETYFHPEKRDVEVLTRTTVMKLDPAAHTAVLSTKEEVEFGQALIATGALVQRLRVEGTHLDGIHYLRTLGNSDAIARDAAQAEHIVLAGGSYIACEVAASLTSMGKRCTQMMLEGLPLSGTFGLTAGRYFDGLLRAHGIQCLCGEGLERLEGEGRVQRVVTAAGRTVDADMVIMGTGVLPDVMLARSAGLEVGESGGVACDSQLRTSAPDIWAAGDMCEYDSVLHGRRMRIEHWDVARSQGAFVAASMLGADRPYDEVPYFWSDLADWSSLEYVGAADRWEREVLRGSPDDGEFAILYLEGSRLVGALSVGRDDDLVQARRLIHERTELTGDPDALAAADLSEL